VNEETYSYSDTGSDDAGMDCMRCGIMIETRQQLGVNCELCDMYFHKSCPGQCDCVNTEADQKDDGQLHVDLTQLDVGTGDDDDTKGACL
jgi:hypothetical protein